MKLPHPTPGARLLGVFLGLLALVGLSACGNSGTGNGPAAGTVTLALTDSPSDAFEAVTVTISSAALLGESGSVDIPFPDNEPITVNLLDLDGINQILATASIPAGTYTKLRLQVSDAFVTYPDGTTQSVHLVANGKVDLNFRGELTVNADQAIVVQLDFSAADSVKLTSTGSGTLILRPQIFVSTTPTSDDGTTPPIDDLEGVIASRNDVDHTLTVNVRRTLRVVIAATDETVILAKDGTPIEFTDLNVGTYVHVEGALNAQGRVVATLIQVDADRLLTRGEVTQLDAAAGTLTLLHRDGTTTAVTFDATTTVYFLGTNVGLDALTNAQIVYVGGTLDETDPATVHATVIRIRPDRLTGTVSDAAGCATGSLSVQISAAHLLARFTAAGITLSPENTIGVDLPAGFSCDGIVNGLRIRTLGRLTPHVPDAVDPNPVRFQAVKRPLFPWHGGPPNVIVVLPNTTLTGTVGTVTPSATDPTVGTFVLSASADAGLFCATDGRPLQGNVTVVVNASTVFGGDLAFSSALEGQNVSVKGVLSASLQRPIITNGVNLHLVAAEVRPASP
ncbi:MAG: DUF4382 domain-containing protein [Nitrospirota bacterium]